VRFSSGPAQPIAKVPLNELIWPPSKVIVKGKDGHEALTPLNPEAIAGAFNPPENTITGKEYRQRFVAQQGWNYFDDRPLYGPFGTVAAPVLVPTLSPDTGRAVGCLGGNGREHDLVWMLVRPGAKHMCRECSQVFQLFVKPTAEDELVIPNLPPKVKDEAELKAAVEAIVAGSEKRVPHDPHAH
jgi:hypothetical protein